MSLRRRHLSPAEFGRYAAELRLVNGPFQDRLLEFLEQERILVPAVRVRWPRSIIIADRGGSPDPAPSPQEIASAQALAKALSDWRQGPATAPHPYDVVDPKWADLVEQDVTKHTFEPWSAHRTNIRPEGEPPLFVTDAVDTFYHGWQALLLADALDMGLTLLFDIRPEGRLGAAVTAKLSALEKFPKFGNVSLEGARGLDAAEKQLAAFQAVSRFVEVKQRLLNAAETKPWRGGWRLEGEPLKQLTAEEKVAAHAILAAADVSPERLVKFIGWLCERWEEWSLRGRQAVAEEYKSFIREGVLMWQAAMGEPFEVLAGAVGARTSHFANTLDVMFPNRVAEARERTGRSLKHVVLPALPKSIASLTVHETDIDSFLGWLDHNGQRKLHAHVGAVLDAQFSNHVLDHAALANAAEGLAGEWEHLVTIMLVDAGLKPKPPMLMGKLQALWACAPDVAQALDAHHELVSTKSKPFATQWAAIEALPLKGLDAEAARLLLKAVLTRNFGTHTGLSGWSDDQLHDAVQMLLSALLLCRKAATLHAPPSGSP